MLGGLGLPEGMALLLIGLFLFGPERLPGMAADLGAFLRKVRVWAKEMSQDLKADLGPEVGDLDLRSLHPREFVRKHLFEDEEPAPSGVDSARKRLVPGESPPWDPDTT